MSTDERSAQDVPTSQSDCMESSDTNVKKASEGIEIIYSHLRNDTKKPDYLEAVNLVECLPKINPENDSTTDSSSIRIKNNSIGDNAGVKNTEITLSGSKNECLKFNQTDATNTQTLANNAVKATNLTESTFGLIPQDPRIENFISNVDNSNNDQSNVQDDVILVENNRSPVHQQIVKLGSINSEKNLLVDQNNRTPSRVEVKKTVNSLSSLATEYASSESEEESEEEEEEERIPSPCKLITIVDDATYIAKNNIQYRSKPEDNDSMNEGTDSDSDTSDESDTSDSDSDTESSSSEVENGPDNVSKAQPSKIKKTKNEFEDLPPIEELKITVPEKLCQHLGEVSGIVEQMVIVHPISGTPTLNLDSILFLEKGHRVLGQVFDVFGQVADPHYCVRFNSGDHIKESGIVVGMKVYYSPSKPEHTSLVFLHELIKLKGVDISGEDDMEPPEFSDDEEERAYNQLQRHKQRQRPGMNERQNNLDSEGLVQKRQCPEWQKNPWSTDRRSRNYNNPRKNRNFDQGSSRWNSGNSQPPYQNLFSSQNSVYSTNQPSPNQYGQSSTPNACQYQFNPYNNLYQQNNMFPPPNPRYAFGQSPGFQADFNNYGSNFYGPNPYPPSPMSWGQLPPPPPPPSSM